MRLLTNPLKTFLEAYSEYLADTCMLLGLVYFKMLLYDFISFCNSTWENVHSVIVNSDFVLEGLLINEFLTTFYYRYSTSPLFYKAMPTKCHPGIIPDVRCTEIVKILPNQNTPLIGPIFHCRRDGIIRE